MSSKTNARILCGILAVCLAIPQAAFATGPALDGVRGLLRVHSADLGTPGYVAGSFYALYAQERYWPDLGARGAPEDVYMGGAHISLGYTATPHVELAVQGQAETQVAKSLVDDPTDKQFGIGNVQFALKTLLTPADRQDWKLGAELHLGTTTGSDKALVGTWDADGLDVGGQLNLTFAHVDPQAGTGLRVHANAGYLNRTGEFDPVAWAASYGSGAVPRSKLHGDQFHYGAALEIPVPNQWTFFAEWSGEYDTESEIDFDQNPMRVTPGLRYATPGGSFVWTAAYERSLGSEVSAPPWQIITGLTFGGYAAPVYGDLIGHVRDAETGQPIPNAKISVRDTQFAGISTNGEGRFETPLPEGYAVVELAAEGYNKKSRVVEVDGHEMAAFDFTMTKRNVLGSFRGKVRDSDTGNPLFARVRVVGTEDWVETDPATGGYSFDKIEEGDVEIEVQAKSYLGETANVLVAAGETASQDVSLVRDLKPSVGILSGHVRDGKSGEIVGATVVARGKDTREIPVDSETGLYEIELEAGTYNVSVTSPGYLAIVESVDVSEKAAQVKNFDLRELPKTMTLKGVYFDSGTATIKRESFASLENAGQFLINNDDVKVTIEGHTDSRGSLSGNMTLAQRRADSVMKYLVVNYGIEPRRLMAKGVGPHEPIASNDSIEGRALNRRIEFELQGPAVRH